MYTNKNSGFTLIEVMIAVAIVAILAAVALPSYNDYVIRGKIPEATNALAAMRVKLEQYYQDQGTYVNACKDGTVAPKPANTSNFTFTCKNLDVNTYEVFATGKGSMNGFEYKIDEKNVQTTTQVPDSSWGASGTTCWIVRKGGLCS